MSRPKPCECSDTLATNFQQQQLPPDPDGQNDDRASWAETALQSFVDCTGSDQEDALSDLGVSEDSLEPIEP